MRIRALAAIPILLAAAVLTCSAQAHDDPASDVLIDHDVFFPYSGGGVSESDEAALTSVLQQANARGMTVRAAVIAGAKDLGPITRLWRKPRAYATFLGGEDAFSYKKGLLLTVMPNGFGLFRGNAAQQRILDRIPTGRTAEDLVKAATTGVERLAAAQGIKLAPRVPKSTSSSDRLIIILGGGAVLAGLGIFSYLRFQPSRASRPA